LSLAALVAGGLLLAGCVVTSVYPWYTAKDVVFDPALIGTWVEATSTNGSNEGVRFERGEGDAYIMTMVEKDKSVTYDSHLFKLKNRLFLDYCPREGHDDFIPPHNLLKVESITPTFRLAGMSYKWLSELVEKNPKSIRHILVGGKPGEPKSARVVLTADTAELQKFLLKNLTNTNAFDEPAELKRQ